MKGAASCTLARTAGALGATGLIVGTWWYWAMWPTSQTFGRTIIAGSDPDEVALTYDDGPNDRVTSRLLELLSLHKVRATFFLIGRYVKERPDLARAIAAEGHLIGNHTMNHPMLATRSAALIREELRVCNEAIEDAIGARVDYFRPPFGARRPFVMSEAERLGMRTVQWNVTGYDWKSIPPETILKNIAKGMKRTRLRGKGSTLLLHDGGHAGMGQDRDATLAASDRLIVELKASGHRFVTPDVWG